MNEHLFQSTHSLLACLFSPAHRVRVLRIRATKLCNCWKVSNAQILEKQVSTITAAPISVLLQSPIQERSRTKNRECNPGTQPSAHWMTATSRVSMKCPTTSLRRQRSRRLIQQRRPSTSRTQKDLATISCLNSQPRL